MEEARCVKNMEEIAGGAKNVEMEHHFVNTTCEEIVVEIRNVKVVEISVKNIKNDESIVQTLNATEATAFANQGKNLIIYHVHKLHLPNMTDFVDFVSLIYFLMIPVHGNSRNQPMIENSKFQIY